MIRLTQTTSLQQKMAPQLIQSLRLLQMPTLELEQLIQQELQINPLLELEERLEDETETEEDPAEEAEENEEPEEDLEELEFEDTDLDKDEFDEDDWDDYLNDSGYSSPREEHDPNIEEWENDGANQTSLEETLKEQLLLTDLSEAARAIGEYIIGNIDEDDELGLSLVPLLLGQPMQRA